MQLLRLLRWRMAFSTTKAATCPRGMDGKSGLMVGGIETKGKRMAEAAAIKKVEKSSREQGKQISEEMTTLLQQLLRESA